MSFAPRPHELPRLDDGFAADFVEGLSRTPKRLAPKYFYDRRGSELFERICLLPEYYPTRAETALLWAHAAEIAARIGPEAELVEFGAGAGEKVRILLDALDRPAGYLPVDISGPYLDDVAAGLRRSYPGLPVRPVTGDFSAPETLGLPSRAGRRVGFFPGSTIGNFEPEAARDFLARARPLLAGGGMLIGVDLVKDPAALHAAYNDRAGVTAAFNLNLLARANRELGAGFRLDRFWHHAAYEPMRGRVAMYLVSRERQTVPVAGRLIKLEEGEAILTEYSYKYTKCGFRALALASGYTPTDSWVDQHRLFSLHWLES